MKTAINFLFYLLFMVIFFGCTSEEITNIYNNNVGLGKVNIYIEGNITNAEAQAKLTAEIGTQTENIYVQETTQLTDLTINLIGNIRDIYLDRNFELKNLTINGNNAKANTITISEYTPYGDDFTDRKFENININGIVEVKNLTCIPGPINHTTVFNCNDLINIRGYLQFVVRGSANFNKLKYINSEITHDQSDYFRQIGGIYGTLNVPELQEAYNLKLSIQIETFNLPKLKKLKRLVSDFYVGFQNLNLPQLERCDVFVISKVEGTSSNPSINFPNMTYCKDIGLSNINLDTNKVNAILHHFLNVNPTSGKYINLIDNSPPSGQGLIDKQTLMNQGNTVETD